MLARILPVVLILIAIGLFFTYTHPTYTGSVARIRADIAGLDGALKAADTYEAKKSQLMAERARIPDESISRLEVFLPDSVDNVQLIVDLNSLADRSNIELSDFDMDAAALSKNTDRFNLEDDGPVESLELSMSATGTYAAFKTFLKSAEVSLRPLDLVSVSVQDSPTNNVYTYNMTFRIYWLAPN